MTSVELSKLAKQEDKTIKELVRMYKEWEVSTGLVVKPTSRPSDSLEEKLGSTNILDEAMYKIIEKALPLLDNKETMAQGAGLITKVYDSVKGNKGASNITVNTQVSNTTVEAQKQALIEMREDHMKKFKDVK
jgi:hypothetical protein